MEFLSRLPEAHIDENALIEVTMRLWSRLVPSPSQHWLEHDLMVAKPDGTLALIEEGGTPSKLKLTKRSSVFYRLRLAYAMLKKKETEEKAAKNAFKAKASTSLKP